MRTLGHAPPFVGDQAIGTRRAARQRTHVLIASAYAALASLLVSTRLAGLHRSFWTDEVVTVTDYVRAGPRAILAGPYIPNNHELFSILGWLTTSVAGESEIALRLLSVVPFLIGVAIVTAWLHVRVGPLSGLLFLFFATASPLLFDLSRQARGYGLAFLAMAAMLVAALEVDRTARTRMLAVFFAAGLGGSLTLPNFGLAFVATALALATAPSLSRRVAFGIAGSTLVIAVWYAPHIRDLLENSQQENGAPIGWFGLLTSPVDHVLVPGVLWFGDTFLANDWARLLLVLVAAVLLLSSPLIRERRTALLLCAGPAATLFFVWATRLYLAPRFVSYLLVPLFMLLATGTARLLQVHGLRPRAGVLVAMVTIAVAAAAFVGSASQLLRFPAEAWKEASTVIDASSSADAPVVAQVSRPEGLRYYLARPVRRLYPTEVVAAVCRADREIVYVTNAYEVQPVAVPCLGRSGVRFHRLSQHSYGGHVSLWVVPVRN